MNITNPHTGGESQVTDPGRRYALSWASGGCPGFSSFNVLHLGPY